MATNVYFSQKVRSEQNLYEDIIIESLKIYGQDVYYLPRTIVDTDYILNEAVESRFDDAYIIESYIENTDGFGGEGDLMSKFGLEIRDTATFIISKRRWEQLIGITNNNFGADDRPLEGDLIYLPLSKKFFQIDFVENEAPFYQLSNLPTYKLQCSLFEFAEESINTGNIEIDSITDKYSYSQELYLREVQSRFIPGEVVSFSIDEDIVIESIVESFSKIDDQNYKLSVNTITTSDGNYHQYLVGGIISSISSTGSGKISKIIAMEGGAESVEAVESDNARNQDFKYATSVILDFSESNPFGEPEE
jgi:hypothetical protein